MGGLSVLQELRRELPTAHFLYLADSAHMPYGEKSEDEVRALTTAGLDWLRDRGCRGAVVACNTASAFSLAFLRQRYGPGFPIVGLVPALKPAVAATESGTVAVLATPVTLRGEKLAEVIQQFAKPAGVTVLRLSHPELVPLIEAGQANSARARAVLREVLTPAARAGADQLVLGCTHFPFLTGAIRAEFGEQFALLDSGAAVARRTREVLGAVSSTSSGMTDYFTTGLPQRTASLITALLEQSDSGEAVRVQQAHLPTVFIRESV